MHIELNRSGTSVKLFKQIAGTIADRIRSGLLAPGTRLPSVRQLSASLAVSQVTVSRAYAELESGHLIICSQGKGCFVAASAPATPAKQEADQTWQMTLVDYLPRAQLWRNFNHQLHSRYPFHLAALHPSLLPVRDIVDNAYRHLSDNPELMAHYGAFEGDLELRAQFADLLRQKGIQVSADQVLITSGAQQGIDLVARTFVGPGDVVYVEAPTYTGAIDVFTSRGAKIIMVPMDEQGMKLDMLTRLCDQHPPKLIYTNPTFHNPTGLNLSLARRKQLLELAASYHCLIVEDDPFSELYFDSPPPPPIKSFDRGGHVVYIKSFSKILAPGCRIACMAAQGSVLSRLIAAKSTADLGSPLLTQKALLPFLTKQWDKHVSNLRRLLSRRLQIAVAVLAAHAPRRISWVAPKGGLNLWIKLPDDTDLGRLSREADKRGISFLPGEVCYAGGTGMKEIRISYSFAGEEELREGLKLLCELLSEDQQPLPPEQMHVL